MKANAGRIVLEFSGKNLLTKVHAEDRVRLLQHQNLANASASQQDLELTAHGMDFFMAEVSRARLSHAKQGSHLDRAETSGIAQITIRPTTGSGPQTLVTAAKFDAHFDSSGQFTSVHGAPDARIVSQNPGEPDRVSTSRIVDATFQPGSGIQSIVQQGNVAYVDGERKAWGDRARYTPADQVLILTGSPRVTDGGMTTTANSMRLNRATGDAFAEGDVKSTYSDLKPQPSGALLSSSSPIHVTARVYERPWHFGDRSLHRRRPALAGRQCSRGAVDRVRPRPPFHGRHWIRRIPNGLDGAGSNRAIKKASPKHRLRLPSLPLASPTPTTSAKLTSKATSWPKEPTSPSPPKEWMHFSAGARSHQPIAFRSGKTGQDHRPGAGCDHPTGPSSHRRSPYLHRLGRQIRPDRRTA